MKVLVRLGGVLLALLMLSRPAWSALTIEITSGTEGAMPIAVVPFGWQGATAAPEDVGAIVTADLARSGQFAPIPEADMLSHPTEGKQVQFRDWRALGVDNLVVGQLNQTGPDSYQVKFQLFDVFRADQLLGYNIPSSRAQLRQVAHYISDLIYEKLTGERGAFQTRIAYITVTGTGKHKQYSLQVADSDGHNPVTVVNSQQPLMSPAWSPNGAQIAYVSFENKRAAIYIQDLSTGKRRRVAAFEGVNGAPAWSPDGTRLAITLSQDGNPEIYILNLATGQRQRLTHNPAIDTEAAWSPDGKSLVFTSDRGGSPQLYRMPVQGGAAERLTFEGNYNASADFSPDGKRIALVHRDNSGNFRVAVQDLERGTLTLLSNGKLDESPSFAPNGRMVLYATEAGGHGVLAASSVDGRVGQRLRFQEGDVREPAWSPFLK